MKFIATFLFCFFALSPVVSAQPATGDAPQKEEVHGRII